MGIFAVLRALGKIEPEHIDKIVRVVSEIDPERLRGLLSAVENITPADIETLQKTTKLLRVATETLRPEDVQSALGLVEMFGGKK